MCGVWSLPSRVCSSTWLEPVMELPSDGAAHVSLVGLNRGSTRIESHWPTLITSSTCSISPVTSLSRLTVPRRENRDRSGLRLTTVVVPVCATWCASEISLCTAWEVHGVGVRHAWPCAVRRIRRRAGSWVP